VAGVCECPNETSGSIKCGGISWLAEKLLPSQEGLYSMESVRSQLLTDIKTCIAMYFTICQYVAAV
jgi:hypothetical protein